MSTAHEDTDTPARGPAAMRAAVSWFLDQRTLPRHETLKLWDQDLAGFLRQLIPAIEALAASLPLGDVSVRVASVAVRERERGCTSRKRRACTARRSA
ncbi:DUF6415 family natural product biosynthesis protein [Streptomyces sp. HUAS 31]|uniref:DUF6415 family natural product biosynthesis protein n=1 Tax=Streptomyces sp. HUAS 31 TaxID=3020055 RepID=UPI002306A582|nr:DUF6415 family natural product biosynthesis protein [Streptomyces sp. HUAS 31]WCD98251.1 DUF6415 family natural product biosynthesis protein [Streptomyces sp. HUAS 31]